MSDKWDEFIHGGSETKDDIQKITENAYDAIRKAEEPTCSICGNQLVVLTDSKETPLSDGIRLEITHKFGCMKCETFGYGGTVWQAVVNYVKTFMF